MRQRRLDCSSPGFIRQRDSRLDSAWRPANNAHQHASIFAFRKVSADRAKGGLAKTTTPHAIVDFIVRKQPVTNRHPVCDSKIIGLAQLFELLCDPGFDDGAILLRSVRC